MATWLVSESETRRKGDSRVQEDAGLCRSVINSSAVVTEGEFNPDERDENRAGNIAKKINIKTPTSHKQGVKCRKYHRVLTVKSEQDRRRDGNKMRKKQTKGLLKAAEDAKRQEWRGGGERGTYRHAAVFR